MDTSGHSLQLAFERVIPAAMVVVVVAALTAGCSDESTDVTGGVPTVSAVEVSPELHTLFSVGERYQLSATATDERGREISGVTFSWSTRDADVATVDSHGEVTGVGAGSTVVTASTGAAGDSAVIWVDPELTLQNYCATCHGTGSHGATFQTSTCRSCHSMSLSPLDEDHSETVKGHTTVSGGFQLAGAHETIVCGMCHDLDTGEPLFTPVDYTDCISCHLSEYERQHGGSDYPTTCLSCHNMSSWTDVTFDHGAVSGGFALVGTHQTLACTACHDAATGDPLYNPAGQDDCYACHQSDYQSQHAGSGYPTTCLTCHTTSGWGGASFDHATASGGFALVGTHQTLACTACHDAATGDPLYDPSGQDDCYACHQSDYQSEHAGSGYPTACLTCHTTSGWDGASFDHDSDYFPIYSGTHAGRWTNCTTCHKNSNDFSEFTCFACHAHNKNDMDAEHASVSGYTYDSRQCLACHPNG